MPLSGTLSFAYTKACGIYGKSFSGKRIARLSSLSRLSDLDRLLFPDSPLDVNEKELSNRTERRIIDRSLDSLLRVLCAWATPPSILLRLLRAIELSELKSAFAAKGSGDRRLPPFSRLGPWGQVHWDAWPDTDAMIADTEYAWAVGADLSPENRLALETSFDRRYYEALWEELPRGNTRPDTLRALVAEEIRLKNITWALRLCIYYNYSPERASSFLIPLVDGHEALDAPARVALELAPDRREDWLQWSHAELVNEESRGSYWKIDPVQVQNRAALRLARRSRRLFRQRPFTVDALAAWIRLVQFEEDLLTAVAEGLSLGMGVREILDRPEAP